jgi:hypothetical protein
MRHHLSAYIKEINEPFLMAPRRPPAISKAA